MVSEEEKNRIIEVKRRHEDEILYYDDVHAVSIGYKIIDGKQTDTLAIVVHTVDKKEIEDIPKGQFIPPHLEGIPTDVVELPPFQILPIETSGNDVQQFSADDKKYRPAPGGVEIYTPSDPVNGGICTLGMYARSTREGDDPNALYLLTNAHCLPQDNQQVLQPKSENSNDLIAYAARTVRSDLVDGGIAKLTDNTLADAYEILDIGTPTGVFNITIDNIGQLVIKRGRTTDTTEGYIAYVDVALIDIREQIIIGAEIPFAAPGDSGSVVLFLEGEHRHNVTGLLWGGVLTYAIMSPIETVTEQLEIELVTRDEERES